jgi:hypothetical protein
VRLFTINYDSYAVGRIASRFSQPYFSKIMKYDEFSHEHLSIWLDKLKLSLINSLREL